MDSNPKIAWLFIVTILIGFGTSAVAALYGTYLERRRGKQSETFEDKVARFTSSLTEAAKLVGNIESEIKARSALAAELQKDLDRYNKLVEIKKPEVEAIALLLRGELRKEGRTAFWKSLLINFLFFVLGAAASVIISKLFR